MYDILIKNLHAERLGNWEEYIQSLKLMLPYFAAAGHRAYTKCIYLFIQKMGELDPYTLNQFKECGHFVVRRSNRPAAGISVDLTIEQTLMVALKGPGGFGHGRTFNELSYLTWILSRPITSKIDEQIREMTKVSHSGSETEQSNFQVKAERESRKTKDYAHMQRIESYLTERCLFNLPNSGSDEIMNLNTGFIAPKEVNVDKALSIGDTILKSMVGLDPLTFTIKKTSLAVQIPTKCVAKGPGDDAVDMSLKIDPQLFFQRALSLASSETVDVELLVNVVVYQTQFYIHFSNTQLLL